MENYGDLPAPQARARDAAASPPPPRAAELYDEEEGSEEGDVPEFTCHFCGRQDPSFTPEALDLHYWRECPMLIQCQLCEQVIEIAKMYSHLCEECEAGGRARAAARGMLPDECPLCRAQLGACEEADWMAHLLDDGCARNPRDRRSGAAADCPGR
ncbi:unnamed protein product [Prorocentrum cordatum]|uniref:Centrosomal protein CEP104 Zn finger domain-containing protein n=1 Tax=Prorocentrum cordatum TaxID=2364126 RepID=A0ABN9XMK5_9DINO|nr:unnamed protein product [Polarella glacialis]